MNDPRFREQTVRGEYGQRKLGTFRFIFTMTIWCLLQAAKNQISVFLLPTIHTKSYHR